MQQRHRVHLSARPALSATAAAGLALALSLTGCTSSGGSPSTSTSPGSASTLSAPVTGSDSVAPESSASSEVPPTTETFTAVTKSAYLKLSTPLAKLGGVNNVTFYPKTHSLIVYYKPGATPKQHSAVEAAVRKQHGKPSPSGSPSS